MLHVSELPISFVSLRGHDIGQLATSLRRLSVAIILVLWCGVFKRDMQYPAQQLAAPM